MRLAKWKMAVLIILSVSGCAPQTPWVPIAKDRAGYSDAWYYERLTPYYTNNLFLNPRVSLRAVRELVGVPVVFDDGTAGHADVFRNDIELFLSEDVTDNAERRALAKAAIRKTCPQTTMTDLESRIAYAAPRYLVFHGVPCLGHAS